MSIDNMQPAHPFKKELFSILHYWEQNLPDPMQGGFYGRIDENNIVDKQAPRGAVLNARILWSFSAAFNAFKEPSYLLQAEKAFDYITRFFIDREYGGVYWLLTSKGEKLDPKKQIYAQAFMTYAMAEFYKASGNTQALEEAVKLYQCIEQYSYDKEHGGYGEAYAETWEQLQDMRLSEKDANEKKTMNTHLHIIEAYANLYSVWEDDGLKQKISSLLRVFSEHIIDKKTSHLHLFMDERWNVRSPIVSFGHTIEAAWLLQEAAEMIKDEQWIKYTRKKAVDMARASLEGMGADGSMLYEYDRAADHWIKEKHWWVQAEAMVGFLNAYAVSGDQLFLDSVKKIWHYTKEYIIDSKQGEWFWGRTEDNKLMPGQDKAGIWKCPYHNSRAMLEIIKRYESVVDQIFTKTIIINARPSKVWNALTDRILIKKWMAETELEIITDWKTGSPIIIEGDLHGIYFRNAGTVLEFEPERVLKYNHLSSISELPDKMENYSVIEFRLMPEGDQTSLTLTLSNFPTEIIYKHLAFYWNGTLEVIKKLIEQH